MLDPDILGAGLAEIVRAEVASATAGLQAQIKTLTDALAERPAATRPGPTPADEIAEQVRAWMEANPPTPGKDGIDGRDGSDGRDGVDGKDGEAGPAGEKGLDGADGIGMAGAIIDKDGELVLTNTKGEAIRLGLVVGQSGKDGGPGVNGQKGDPGRDGMDLTHFDTHLSDDGRVLTLSLESDEVKVTHELELGGMIYRGVFKDGDAYVKGDTVTWGGSLFIAKGPTSEKPDASKDWALAAKKGRDGKDGSPGKPGERGIPGLNGKDGKPW